LRKANKLEDNKEEKLTIEPKIYPGEIIKINRGFNLFLINIT